MGERLSFKDMVDIGQWKSVQDHFSDVLGIGLRTVDTQGIFLTRPSGYTRLCEEVVKSVLKGATYCSCCAPHTLEAANKDWRQGYVCPLIGLHNFAIPLNVGGETAAYIIAGPVILGRHRENEEYEEKARKLGVEAEKFLDALREIKAFSFHGIKSVTDLLHDIGFYMCALGYQNVSLKEVVPEAPQMLERVHDFYVDRMLDALLEISSNFTEAERGSVMLLNEGRDELYIKIAKGLGKEIVEQARSKVGEGIAGIVAREKKPMFIDDNVEDERVRGQFRNPRIRYAISVPIKVKDKAFGVLNIGTYKSDSPKFSSKTMNTIDKLTQLVGATLTSIPQFGIQ